MVVDALTIASFSSYIRKSKYYLPSFIRIVLTPFIKLNEKSFKNKKKMGEGLFIGF